MWTPDASIIITAEQKVAEARTNAVEQFRAAIQSHVDDVAKSRRYDNGNSLASYVASTNVQWASEAQAFVAWRDCVWAYAYVELEKVLSGERDKPTIEEFLNELEPIVWPET